MATTTEPKALSYELAEFFSSLQLEDVPDHVVADARFRLMDTLGVAIAGSRMDYADAVLGVVTDLGGREEATVVGSGARLPAPAAGFINAAFAHGPDYDDTHSVAMVHIGCLAVPAALAMAERQGASGAELLTALVAGAEVGLRIGAAAPHRFHMRGFHATGVVGAFVGATAAGRLLGLDATQLANALGLAGSQAAGLLQGLHDGSWVKRLHPAWTVQAGILAALLAQRGFIGPTQVLEGGWGLYSVLLKGDEGPVDPAAVVRGLGSDWLLPETTYKPYSSGAWNHSTMDGVSAIMREHGLSVQDIQGIEAHVPHECIPVVCEPREAKIHPGTPYHMKFSLPYSTAILAVLGHADVDEYTDDVFRNPEIADLAARITCHEDPALKPDRFPARVVVTSRDGRRYERSVPAQRGGPGNPMTREDHERKFTANTRPSLGDEKVAKAIAAISAVEQAPAVGELVQALVAT